LGENSVIGPIRRLVFLREFLPDDDESALLNLGNDWLAEVNFQIDTFSKADSSPH
jgi:hypothetical protein